METKQKSSPQAAAPPSASTAPVARLTSYHVKPAQQDAFRQALSEYVAGALQSTGNIMAEAYAERDKAGVLWLVERWETQTHLEAHQKSSPAAAISRLAAEALEAPAETLAVQDLEPLAKEAWQRAPNPDDQPMTVMLFVDAKPGTGAEFKKRYHAAMPQIRGEAGVVTYQLTQIEGAADKFITYEKFRSEQALQDHLKFPFLAPILDFLHSSITNPPFEQGLHKLTELAPLHWK
ncbi:antibiotic biosynthesis monooxygenase [Hymenobacter sp. BT523]|uniref:putative quinol monooxygenase n=1 Tax=Hymenobacter sp. BT523 TaxID=2795725 RepID=UPI0018ED7A33|nr:antibiotic biosynthesis monooxygenase family protein [Hymenobacter sp. BT523]MBJ6110342.1 antibiotic biosynthesis monooxygenase [Hymenobacter sp. BT523]